MSARTQITLDPKLRRRAHAKAAELGISVAAYMRRLLANDLGEPKRRVDISAVFDLVTTGEPTNIARDKDKLIGEAMWENFLRKTGRKPRRRASKVRLP